MSIKQHISRLTTTINLHHQSKLTDEQVANWAGSDVTSIIILDNILEVECSNGNEGVTPENVMDCCGER